MARIVTAQELSSMTPAERKQVFDDSIVLNIEDAPKELLERARARFLERSVRPRVTALLERSSADTASTALRIAKGCI